MRAMISYAPRRTPDASDISRASLRAAGGHAVLQHVLDGADERVELLERGVDIRRDAHALIVVLLTGIRALHHGLADDAVLVPQELVELARLDAVDADVGET